MNLEKLIPNDWKLLNLSELTNLITKGTTPTTNGYSYLKDGVNFVKVESIHANGTFIPSMFAHVGNDCHDSFKRSQLKEGDILFTIAGALGRSGIVSKSMLPANTNQAVAIIRLKKIDNKDFIFHYLRGNYIKRLIERINVSTAQANLSLGQINKFKIPLPPLPERQKIAAILGTVDAKIEVIDQQIAETQALKKGLMQRLLTKGIRHTKFKDSPFGEIPESWEVKLLDDCALRASGHTPNKKEKSYYNGGIKWVSLGDSKKLDKRYISKTKIEISEDGIKNSSAVLHPKGTVLLSRDAGVGKSAIMKTEMAVSQHFIVWRCEDDLNNSFLYYTFQQLKPLFERVAIGSTIKTIGLGFFKKLKIVVPLIEEQILIANILNTVDDKLEILIHKKKIIQELKQGLMQQLLTGKVRVQLNTTVSE